MNKYFFICILFFSPTPVTLLGQGPYCPGFSCVANDVVLTDAKLVDVNGSPVPKVFCEEGDTLPGLFLSLTFQVNANFRYEINLTADLLLNGIFIDSFSFCLGDLSGPMSYTFQLQQIPWPCDATLSLNNAVISWQNSSGSGEPCMTCTTAGKCSRFSPLQVTCPLACSIQVSKDTGTGVGSLKRAVTCSTPGDTIRFDSLLLGDTITTPPIYIGSAQGPVVVKCTFNPHIYVYSDVVSFEVYPGGSLEILNVNFIGSINGSFIGGNHFVHSLYNQGLLKLKNVEVYQHPQIPTPGELIYNSSNGQLMISGGNVHLH